MNIYTIDSQLLGSCKTVEEKISGTIEKLVEYIRFFREFREEMNKKDNFKEEYRKKLLHLSEYNYINSNPSDFNFETDGLPDLISECVDTFGETLDGKTDEKEYYEYLSHSMEGKSDYNRARKITRN
jgi:hypothetical protein